MRQICCCLLLLLVAVDFVHVSPSVTSPAKSSLKKAERNGGGRKHRQRDQWRGDDDDGVCAMELSCRTPDGQPLQASHLKLPIRGPPGPPGPPGEKGEKGEDGVDGLPGLPENFGPVDEPTEVVFDRVVTNIGRAYSVENGHFTSPLNATYQFNVVVSAQGKQRAAVMIVKNGAMIATVWAESIPYWGTASSVAIISMERDDQVWLLLLNRASHLHGYMYSTFSGFLLFEN